MNARKESRKKDPKMLKKILRLKDVAFLRKETIMMPLTENTENLIKLCWMFKPEVSSQMSKKTGELRIWKTEENWLLDYLMKVRNVNLNITIELRPSQLQSDLPLSSVIFQLLFLIS